MFGVRISKLGSASKLGLIAKAIAILRSYGADAHVYLPGIGTVNGLTAGNYLDSAGTTAASVDNPVGLSLDALQAMTLGSELVTNGTNPTVTTGWTPTNVSVDAVSFEFQVTRSGSGGWASQLLNVTVGKTYVLTATARKGTSNLAYLRVSSAANGVSPYGADAYTSSATNVPLTVTFVASATTAYVNLGGQDLAGTVFYNNISVREIPGIHATQATTANKPILRRGLLNQLLQSTSFTSPWATIGTSIVPSATTYNNGDAAVLFQETAGGTFHELRQPSLSFTAGSPVTLAFIAKKSTSTAFQLFVTSSVKLNAYANFNLNAGSLGAVGAGATSSIADLGGGWYLTVLNVTPASTVSHYAYTCLINGDVNSAIDPSYSGTLGNGVYLYRAGLFQGTYTAQQIIDAGGIPLTTSAAASSTTGKYWWQFDGSNDSLSLSAPLFQMSDDHCVIAGFNSAVANKYIFSQANSGTPTQCCSLRVDASGYPGAVWIDDASANALPTASTSCIGLSTVATAIKIGNAKRLRVNGVQAGATNNTALGVGTTNSYAIGCLNVSSGNFQGSIYPVIAIKGTLSDSDLLVLERFVGQLSGVQI